MQKKVVRFSREDYQRILDWLENEENFNDLYVASQKTKVDGQSVTKSPKLNELANILNIGSNNQLNLTGQLLRFRLLNYKQTYQKNKTCLSRKTGARVSLEEQQSAVRTLKELVERICMFYERMERFFGKKANVNQQYVIDLATADSVDEEDARGNASDEALELEPEFQSPIFNSSSSPSPSQPPSLPPHSSLSSPSHAQGLSRRQQRSNIIENNVGQ